VIWAAACGEPAHTNPFDPSTPPSQQATAALRGSIDLEPSGSTSSTLSGVAIGVSGPKASRTAFTDAAGTWSVTEVPPGTYTITATRPGYRDAHLTGIAVALDDGGTTVAVPPMLLALGRGSVAGHVALILPDGSTEVSGGASVSLRGLPGQTLSGGDGSFRLASVPAGTYALDASKLGYQAGTLPTLVVSDLAEADAGTVSLHSDPGWLSGAVALSDPSGDVRSALVRARGVTLGGTPWESSAHPDASGAYLVSNLPAGSYTVSFELTDHATVTTSAAIAPAQETALAAVLLARDTGSVAGVARLQGVSIHAGVQVVLTPAPSAADPNPLPAAATVTDAAGSWRVDLLPVGSYRIDYARPPGYLPQSATVTVVKGTISAGAITLALDTTATLSGYAVVARPAGGNGAVLVSLSGTDLNGAAVTRSTSAAPPLGAYAFTGLPQGTYAFTYALSPYATQAASGVYVAAGAAVTLPLVTLPVATGGIAGTVSLDVSTVPGFAALSDRSGTVVALLDGASEVGVAVTDTNGGFGFPSVPALPVSGPTYTLLAHRPSFGTRSLTVAPQPGVTMTGNDLTLPLVPCTLSGSVVLYDNPGGAEGNAASAGATATVTLSGTAFNGVPWSPPAAVTGVAASWSFSSLPPGSYDVVVTSAGRSCAAYPTQSVQVGAPTAAGSVQCTDTVAPGVVGLGPPTATGGVSGWVNGSAVTIPVLTPAVDATSPASNLRAYQWVVGAAPSWDAAASVPAAPVSPSSLLVTGLMPNQANTIWVRAIDWVGNTGPAVSIAVVSDTTAPQAPVITTPQAYVPATTTSVTLTGSEVDAGFLRYESCWSSLAVTSACPTSPGCTLVTVAQTFPLPLVPGARTCVWARAVDRAGNPSPVSGGSVVSDLQAPTPPVLAPTYDPATLTVRAEWVDLFVRSAATDQPGTGNPWEGIAWLELDTGLGYSPLCPDAACHAGGKYSPCACGCNDPRLRCSAPGGGDLAALRVPLAGGTTTRVAVRAVDLAGNVGDAFGQQIETEPGADPVVAGAGWNTDPRIAGGVLTYLHYSPDYSKSELHLLDLGTNGRSDPADTTCVFGTGSGAAAPASDSLVLYQDSTGFHGMRRPIGGSWCPAAPTFDVPNAGWTFAAAGERVAWQRYNAGQVWLEVLEPGKDGLLGTADDHVTALGTLSSSSGPMRFGGLAALVQVQSVIQGPATWRLYSASGSFASGFAQRDLALFSWDDAAVSRDGSVVAYSDQTGPAKLCVLTPSPSGTFDPGLAPTCVAAPDISGTTSVATDGVHVVAVDWHNGQHDFTHWWSGPDGRFGTADDTVTRIHPSSNNMFGLQLSGGLLLWTENSGVLMMDLSALRWESAASTSNFLGVVGTNGAGTVFYRDTYQTHARSPQGYETVGPWDYVYEFAPLATELVANDTHAGIEVFTPDSASGTYFTGDGTTTLIYPSAAVNQLRAAPTRVFFLESLSGLYYPSVLEARGADVRSATAANLVRLESAGLSDTWSAALAPHQAFYTCPGRNTCIASAGADDWFGTADDPPNGVLMHPTGSPRTGQPVQNAFLAADGDWLVASEWANGVVTPATYAIHAGPDHLFGTADDWEYQVSTNAYLGGSLALSGGWLAFIDYGPPGGNQVYLYDLVNRSVRQLTYHFSFKSNVTVDRTGRVYWVDNLFSNQSVFVRAP
jgi:hypothetical protein